MDINERDLVGYGLNAPAANWPANKKVALSFVVNYEEGGENTVLNGDCGSEVFLNEVRKSHPDTRRTNSSLS